MIKYTVIVIDDSLSMRKIIKDIINKLDNFEVIDTANDAYDAREKIKKHEPDLVTIDLNMPKMDGEVFLKNLMKLHPMPAIIISSQLARKEGIFENGAIGFVQKPKVGQSISFFANSIKSEFLLMNQKINNYKMSKEKIESSNQTNDLVERKIHPDEVIKLNPNRIPSSKIIAIGSSTGGVDSLLSIFKTLDANLDPIVITQHIPYKFSNSLANRLNEHSKVTVKQASDNMILEKGHAYLAPGNKHLTIERKSSQFIIKLLDGQKVSHHKPSVDVMFRSVNNATSSSAMAIMMTGMGDDGSIAMKELYDSGAYTIAQNEQSCVVFGMPKVAIEIGAVKDICHLNKISKYIKEFCQNKRK